MGVVDGLKANGSATGKGGTIVITASGGHTGLQAVMKRNTIIKMNNFFDVIFLLTGSFRKRYQEPRKKALTPDKFAAIHF
jgi:hypothetical protein